MSSLRLIKPTLASDERKRRPSLRDSIGSYRETRILFLGVLLPLLCVLDLAVGTAQQGQTLRFLQRVSDSAAIEGAKVVALGGDRLAVEKEVRDVFQIWTEHGSNNPNCMLETIDLSKTKQIVSIKSHCPRRTNIGSILLGQPQRRIVVSVRVAFRSEADRQVQFGTLPRVWLVE